MKIKRFYAVDVSKALREVRNTLGPDAVILSTRKLDDKVEVIAADDYDESVLADDNAYQGRADKPVIEEMKQEMHMLRTLVQQQVHDSSWQKMLNTDPLHVALQNRLNQVGFDSDLINHILQKLPQTNDMQSAWLDLLTQVSDSIHITEQDIIKKGGMHVFVGPTGVGKTTSIAKLAARAVLHYGAEQVALVTIDNFRIAAFEQLNIYGKLLGVDVSRTDNGESLYRILNKYQDKRLILIDTAGMSQRDMKISEQQQVLEQQGTRLSCSLVLSTSAHPQAIEQVLESFSRFKINNCILTKLDEATTVGGIYSALWHRNIPVSYITDGQRVPEDIHIAQADNLVHIAFKLAESDVSQGQTRNAEYVIS